MFGLDFSIVIQVLAAFGALCGGAYMAVRGFTGPKPSQEVTSQAIQLASQLADSELRNELIDVVTQAREGLQQQILQLATLVRLELKELAEKDSRGRGELYKRIDELHRRVTSLSLEMARIKVGGRGR